MKIYNLTNCMPTFQSTKMSFVRDIRDRDVTVFEKLQKSKIEVLLQYRGACDVIGRYNGILENSQNLKPSERIALRRDLAEMQRYRDLLRGKIDEVNLKLLEEEGKNY